MIYLDPMQEFFKHLRDVLFPDPKNKRCPHCGGSKCFGLCGVIGGQTNEQTEAEKLGNVKPQEDDSQAGQKKDKAAV